MSSIFSRNSETDASEFLENIKNCFIDTTRIVIYETGLKYKPHDSMLPVSKRLQQIFVMTKNQQSFSNNVKEYSWFIFFINYLFYRIIYSSFVNKFIYILMYRTIKIWYIYAKYFILPNKKVVLPSSYNNKYLYSAFLKITQNI